MFITNILLILLVDKQINSVNKTTFFDSDFAYSYAKAIWCLSKLSNVYKEFERIKFFTENILFSTYHRSCWCCFYYYLFFGIFMETLSVSFVIAELYFLKVFQMFIQKMALNKKKKRKRLWCDGVMVWWCIPKLDCGKRMKYEKGFKNVCV